MVYHSEPHRVRGDFSLPLAACFWPVNSYDVMVLRKPFIDSLQTAIMYIVYQPRDLYVEYHNC